MGDMGEIFNAMKERSKEKRSSNRETSAKYLSDHGLNYISKNGGAHLIIARNGVVVDFWPGTGKWIFRDGKKGRGVKNLVSRFNKLSHDES